MQSHNSNLSFMKRSEKLKGTAIIVSKYKGYDNLFLGLYYSNDISIVDRMKSTPIMKRKLELAKESLQAQNPGVNINVSIASIGVWLTESAAYSANEDIIFTGLSSDSPKDIYAESYVHLARYLKMMDLNDLQRVEFPILETHDTFYSNFIGDLPRYLSHVFISPMKYAMTLDDGQVMFDSISRELMRFTDAEPVNRYAMELSDVIRNDPSNIRLELQYIQLIDSLYTENYERAAKCRDAIAILNG
ncbi:hypothetical protein H6503_04050 [Candidatus Woesearchaeota archaeon]|nr:hypothetical protein [Candidatus Woesearchaeota archaeon]